MHRAGPPSLAQCLKGWAGVGGPGGKGTQVVGKEQAHGKEAYGRAAVTGLGVAARAARSVVLSMAFGGAGLEGTIGFAPSGLSPPLSLSRGRPGLTATEPWLVT